MENSSIFATAINCIDGRVQIPVANWIKLHSQVQYVNMITEPGVDGVLCSGERSTIDSIFEKIQLSVRVHHPKILALVGHHDCLGNPVSFEEHKEQVRVGVELIKSKGFGVRVIGLYVNEWSSIDVICDSDDDIEPLKKVIYKKL